MRAIFGFIRLGRREPFGCLFSTLISATLISALLAGIVYVVYMLIAVSYVKNIITSSTGFAVSAQNIYVNVFTGSCEIDGLHITNPSVYESNVPKKNAENINRFLHIQKLKLEISQWQLLKGKLVISSVDANITYLNCVRISNSIYNLPEFIMGLKKVVDFSNEENKFYLKNFNLFISKANYIDLSPKSDSMTWNTNDFSFKKSDVTNPETLLKELNSAFNSTNAPFIASGLKVLSTTNF